MTHLIPLWDLIFYTAFGLLGGFFGMLYFAHRVNKDALYQFRGEYFTKAVKAWHSAKEKPTTAVMKLLIKTRSGRHTVFFHLKIERRWGLFVQDYDIESWAYISDLEKLPGYKPEAG